MTIPQPDLISAPMGATLVPGGAVFRIWAPNAKKVWLSGDFNGWKQDDSCALDRITDGHWAGYFPGFRDGAQYLFYIEGTGSTGYKRDPRARHLTFEPAFPHSNCLVRDPSQFPWHDTGFRPPRFNDLIVYELHVGAFSQRPDHPHGRFLDLAQRIPYLSSLGITAIELMPVQEYPSHFSLGYNGTDYFSPENDYGESNERDLRHYYANINRILNDRGQPGYASLDVLRGSDHQLRALIDVCHVYGIAVLTDVVYNHAGGGFDDNSIWFLDRQPHSTKNNSLYFTDREWAGGHVFAYWNHGVQQFLIDNAKALLDEYHVDGFRFDEVSVMDHHGGWGTAQAITGTLRWIRPDAITISEYWPVDPWVVKPPSEGGADFDAMWHDGIRRSIRGAIESARAGSSAYVDMGAIAGAIQHSGLRDRWRAVQSLEDHDIVHRGEQDRIARLCDPSNPRSWYARSRNRVATGLLLTTPGIPMLFMGQEFLEDKQWNDDPFSGNQLWWQGLEGGDRQMADFLHFTSDLIALRKRLPALRDEGCHVTYCSDADRVLAFQRWVEGAGHDVMIVASLNESTWYGYQVGFPSGGRWTEAFNSDAYENWVNPQVSGNGGAVDASGPALHGLPASAWITIPANSIMVFVKD